MPNPSAAARLALAVLPLFLAGCSSLAGSGSADTGEASYYGSRHAGLRTASGERYNPNAMTAAHRTLPFGTRVRVTNLDNRRSVVVRINDRGPFPPRADHRCIAQGRRRPGYDPQRRGAGSDRVAGLSHLLPTTGTFR